MPRFQVNHPLDKPGTPCSFCDDKGAAKFLHVIHEQLTDNDIINRFEQGEKEAYRDYKKFAHLVRYAEERVKWAKQELKEAEQMLDGAIIKINSARGRLDYYVKAEREPSAMIANQDE